jgi:cytochrome c5
MTLGAKDENPRSGEDGPRSHDHRRVVRLAWLALGLVVLAALWALSVVARQPSEETVPVPVSTTASASLPKSEPANEPEATHEQVLATCGTCHAYPPPDIFSKADWPEEVKRGFDFLHQAQTKSKEPVPSFASVVAYYQSRAPEALPILEKPPEPPPFEVTFESKGYREASINASSSISNAQFMHLSDPVKFDVVACDMRHGLVLRLKPYEANPKLEVLTNLISHPAHSEPVDLDRDGVMDLLVSNLGTPIPSEQRLGSVVWLRGSADGTFGLVTLADGLGRVADARAADFDGDGDLDLVVAVFGRLTLGEVIYLENQTTDPARPTFVRTVIDPRHGAIHVPVADLNGDGRPDFVALISQEHESVVAFLNTGSGKFEPHLIFAAPHPAFGSSGIELVDLDKDGDLDVLMTNGDVLDKDLLRPYHGIRWLENQGGYPFKEHPLTSLYGAHRAVAADFDGDGDLDIAATTFLPPPFYEPLRKKMKLDSVLILEQTSPGTFVRHSLESVTCDHATCDTADFDGDGKPDLVIGNFFPPLSANADWVVVMKNLGRKDAKP